MTSALFSYVIWHFTVAPRDILRIMLNYQRAHWRKFFIPEHLATLFSPWHRLQPSDLNPDRPKTIGDRIVDPIVNFYIRLLAAFLRSVVIILGLAVQALTAAIFAAIFVTWIFWPVISIGSVIIGVGFLFS